MKRRNKDGTRDVSLFPLDTGLKKPQRIAAFLDWWAQRHPYDFSAYNELLKAIEGYKHLPRITSDEVDSIRSRVRSAERILLSKFGRVAIRNRGLGIRASVDDEDMLRNKQVDRVVKIRQSIEKAIDLDKRIDLAKVPNGALKNWYIRGGVRGILSQVGSQEQLQKLLPPKPADGKSAP